MVCARTVCAGEIGHGPRKAEDAVSAASREPTGRHRAVDELDTGEGRGVAAPQQGGGDGRVQRPGLDVESVSLALPGVSDACRYGRRRFDVEAIGGQLGPADRGNGSGDVDPISDRSGQPLSVPGPSRREAGALRVHAATSTARAWVGSEHQLKRRRITSIATGARDHHLAALQRLTARFEYGRMEFGYLVEKQDTPVYEPAQIYPEPCAQRSIAESAKTEKAPD